jgi:hypothetical protein
MGYSIMEKPVQTLGENLQRAFGALALEHAGEMLTRSSKSRILAASAPQPGADRRCDPPAVTPMRLRVGLALEADAEAAVLGNALDVAIRLDADLDILTSRNAAQVREEIARELGFAAERCNVIQLGRDLAAGVSEYTRCHPETLFVFKNTPASLTGQQDRARRERRGLTVLFREFLRGFSRSYSGAAKTYS